MSDYHAFERRPRCGMLSQNSQLLEELFAIEEN